MSEPTAPRNPDEERARAVLAALRTHPQRPSAALRADARKSLLGLSGARRNKLALRWRALALAAATLAIALVGWHLLRETTPWSVLAGTGSGEIQIDGTRFAVADRPRWSALVRPGAIVSTGPGVELELTCGDAILLVITEKTAVTVPDEPGRYVGRTSTLRLDRGEIRATTGPGFPGMEFRVEAKEASAAMTGTTIAVIRNDQGTCLCVLEGSAALAVPNAEPVPVTPAQRRLVFGDGAPPRTEAILDMERMKLQMLRDRAGTVFIAR